MNASLKQTIIVCLFGCGSLFFGCQGAIWQCKKPQQEIRQERFVRIGGRVNNPGRFDLDSSGLTLRQGMQLAAVSRNEALITSRPRDVSALSIRTNAGLAYETATRMKDSLTTAVPNRPLEPDAMLQLEVLKNRVGILENMENDIIELGKEDGLRKVKDAFDKVEEVYKTENATASQIDSQLLLVSLQGYLLVLENFIKDLPQVSDVNATVTAFNDAAQLISLRRQSGGSIQTFLFPYSFVMNGDAGGIALEHGDFVAVVPVSESPLNVRETGDGTISVAGYVRNGGELSPAEAGKRSVGDIFNFAGNIEGVDYEMISCVLSRYSTSGDGLITVIAPAPHRDSFTKDILVSGGDQISFTPTPLAPLLVNSFLAGSARNAISDEVIRRKSSATGLRKAAESAQQCVNQFGEQTRNGFNQIRNGQVPSLTQKRTDSTKDRLPSLPARMASR